MAVRVQVPLRVQSKTPCCFTTKQQGVFIFPKALTGLPLTVKRENFANCLTTNTEQKENKTTFPKTSPAIAFTPTEYQSNTLLKNYVRFANRQEKFLSAHQ